LKEDLEKPPGFEPLLNGGLELLPAPGLPLPPKLGLGFQPGFPPGSWPEPESVRGGRGANEPSPSSRRNEGRAEPPGFEPKDLAGAPVFGRPLGFHPVDEGLSPVRPGLLLGRAPPARGLPLLVVKGRGIPPSPRKERDEPARSELDRPEPDGGALERPPEAAGR